MKKKWMPMGHVRPGKMFQYKRVTFLRIQGITSIGKEPFNLVHVASGKLGYLDQETAVKV